MALPLHQKTIAILKENPNRFFTAREIAQETANRWPDDFKKKRANPRFSNNHEALSQVAAEIGSRSKDLMDKDANIVIKAEHRPKLFGYVDAKPDHYLEESLYQKLAVFALGEWGLRCMRIDEKRSSNRRDKGGNRWLHPDVVGMEMVDNQWNSEVRLCIQKGGHRVVTYSFEVKRTLTLGNVRECFFQAVSNSSWAHLGFLVAAEVDMERVGRELSMLSALHGIGVIALDRHDPEKSTILLPARLRSDIDWESVNRIAVENPDFREYVVALGGYIASGVLAHAPWMVNED